MLAPLKKLLVSGTAAVVAQIAEIGYNGQNIKLPTLEDSESLAALAKNEINGLRSGRIEDKRGWIVKVQPLDRVESLEPVWTFNQL